MNPSRTGWVVGGVLAVVLVGLIVPAIYQAREAARRTQSRNNLKQLGLALHNYHDTFSVLPPGGVFNAGGKELHEWTTLIAPFLDSSPWYLMVKFHIPWDDPRQVDLFRQDRGNVFLNPSVTLRPRPDGLNLNHYAASQTVMSRNSSESFTNWNGTAERLLVAEVLDRHLPLGCPYGWRDITLGLGQNPDGFGCRPRPFTHCLMGDGSIRSVENSVAAQVLEAMAGPVGKRPKTEQVQRITEYPPLDVSRIWRVGLTMPGGPDEPFDKFRITVQRTSPDGRTVVIGNELPELPAEPGSQH